MIFLSGIILLIAACLVLDHFVRPRCERHHKKVAIARLPALGCWECVEKDLEIYHREHPGAGE